MAINKAFVVKNGLEVNTQLIYADADTNNVGIASTQPRLELDVRGGIAASNTTVSGVSTIATELRVGYGIGGTVFTVLGLNNLVGVGTSQPAYLLDVRTPVSTGQTALYVQGDMRVTGDINLDDISLDYAQIGSLLVTGISTFQDYIELEDGLEVTSGITTARSLNVIGFSTLRANVDVAADVGITSSLVVGAGLSVTGISTFTGLTDINGGVSINGISTFSNNLDINSDVDINRSLTVTGGASVTGISTFTGIGTFGSHLYVDGDFYSRGSLNFSSFGATRGTISGILTTSNLRVTGLSTLTGRADLNGGLSVTGVSTFANNLDINADVDVSRSVTVSNGFEVTGISTHTGLTDLNGGLSVTGVSTFADNLNASTSIVIGGGISATGIGTIGNLLITPIGTGATVGNGAGIVTFYGDGSGLTNTPAGTPAGADGQIQFNVSDTFTASPNLIFDGNNLYVSGIVTASTLDVNGTNHDINGSIALDHVTVSAGTTIGGNLDVNGTNHDIDGSIALDHVTISGIATVSSNLDVNGTNHDINGAIALDHVTVSGITTISSTLDVNGTNHDINGAIALDHVTVSGIVTATAFVDDGTNLLTEINTKTSTGKAIAMAMVFG